MSRIAAKLSARGLALPASLVPPAGAVLPFAMVRIIGNRAFVSGHGPQGPDGRLAGPFGKVGREVTIEQGYEAAKLTGLAILGSLARALGDLDRVTAWARVFGGRPCQKRRRHGGTAFRHSGRNRGRSGGSGVMGG